MPNRLKRGRLGKPEMKFIKENVGELKVEQIAQRLNRDVKTVNDWIKENMAMDASGDHPITLAETAIRNELYKSHEWKELSQQFLPDELKTFEHYYCKLMTQFGSDILPTEIIQIFLLIKIQILMDRNLKGRSRAQQDIQRLEKQIDDIYALTSINDMDPNEKSFVLNLENQLVAAREAESSKTTEYSKLSEKHAALMKDLKGTREQRITKVENSKKTFLQILRDLQDEDIRNQENEEIDFMRAAIEKERDRLSASHKYVDDSIDQPLLTPENVL